MLRTFSCDLGQWHGSALTLVFRSRCTRGLLLYSCVLLQSISLWEADSAGDAELSCWQGPFTRDQCCGEEHGSYGNTDCWDEQYTYTKCCGTNVPQVISSSGAPSLGALSPATKPAGSSDTVKCWGFGLTEELCCGLQHGLEGNPTCWDEFYTYGKCCDTRENDGDGCNADRFIRFRLAIKDYYASGLAKPDLIKTFPRMLGDIESNFDACTPAALQAFIFHVEERAGLEPADKVLKQMTHYTLRLHKAVAEGSITPKDLDLWPLDDGLRRLHDATEAFAHRRPNITLVMAYCREDLTWMRTLLSRVLLPSLSLAFVRKCPGVDVQRRLPLRNVWRSVDVVDVEDLPLQADECSAYFGYLAERYERLPEYMIFIHGDAPEHIGSLERPNMLDDVIRALLNGVQLPFLHLSSNRVTMRWVPENLRVLWRGLFGNSIIPQPGEVQTYCCSHMVVSRERAQLRSRQWYAEANAFMMSPKSYFYLPVARPTAWEDDLETQLPCQNMMFLWHIVFGENLYLPHRMMDARLPLFAKVRNIKLQYLEGKTLQP